MSASTIFGRIVTGGDVEKWCHALLKKWVGTYLSEVERQHGLEAGHWQRPRSYTRSMSFDKFPEDQLPAIILISSGLVGRPRRNGDGTYDVTYLMLFGCLCSAKTRLDAHDMAHDYAAAVHTLILQRSSLDGMADGATWLYDRADDLTHNDSRSLAACTVAFEVQVNNVATAGAGPITPDEPLDPDTLPWPDWATVETVDTEVIAYPELDNELPEPPEVVDPPPESPYMLEGFATVDGSTFVVTAVGLDDSPPPAVDVVTPILINAELVAPYIVADVPVRLIQPGQCIFTVDDSGNNSVFVCSLVDHNWGDQSARLASYEGQKVGVDWEVPPTA